jgi:hypothetical protein
MPYSIAWPSSIFSRSISGWMRSEPNRRIKSSSSEMKNWLEPGSPWRPARPPQLVVDAAGFVALGAQNVQSAQPDHLFVLAVGLLAVLGVELPEALRASLTSSGTFSAWPMASSISVSS